MKNNENCIKLGIVDEKIYKYYENIYKKIFEEYILSKINLKNYEEKISVSELGFGVPSSTIKIKSELEEYLNLKYFYILNNFYIEKLTANDLEILKKGTSEEKINLIEKTYKNIILSNYSDGKYTNEKYKVNYTYSTSGNKLSNNDELVIAIYYGKNKIKYNSKDNYLLNYNNKKIFLNSIKDELINEFKEKLDLNIKVIYEKK